MAVKINKFILCAVLAVFACALLVNPQRYCAVCFGGVCLWAESVVPSLFPFMVISLLLSGLNAFNALQKPFKKLYEKTGITPSVLPLIVLSSVSGYPAGSRLVYEYYNCGKISGSEAKKLAPLCSCCSPAFALGTVGYKAFGGGYYGVKLILAAYISVISVSVIYALLPGKKDKEKLQPLVKKQSGNLLYDSFYGAVSAVLCAGGFICFFYTLAQVLIDLKVLAPLTFVLQPLLGEAGAGLAAGLCEATGGIFSAAKAGGFFALPVAGFLVTFGGASILLQQLCYLVNCGVKSKSFIFLKFIQGAVTFILLCLFQLF